MNDSWKGEDFIRGRGPKTTTEKQKRSQEVAQSLLNVRRRQAGQGIAKGTGLWARKIKAAVIHARITKGKLE